MIHNFSDMDEQRIFHYFDEISSIPRGSNKASEQNGSFVGNSNEKISNYLVDFAVKNGLTYKQDEFYNVIIIKEAAKGYEDKPTLILQGHMDMVCEKELWSNHDFMTEPLELIQVGDFISANGTTLGGDDGIAIAYALALLEDNSLIHPRLEIVVTTDEEVGMDGAKGLNTECLKGRYLLNIDSEEEGIFLSSCAGGLTGTCRLHLNEEIKRGIKVSLTISGLKGGHSGMEIQKNRVNGTILMGRLLFELGKEMPVSLIQMEGGQKDNAIPRVSHAVIMIEDHSREEFSHYLEKLKTAYENEFKSSEPDFSLDVRMDETECTEMVLDAKSKDQILFLLLNAPNGVQVMSSDIDGLVESSLNLGILKAEKKLAVFCYSVRSSLTTYKRFLSNKLQNLIDFIGGEYEIRGEYESWEYKKDSKLRELFCRVYEREYGRSPKIEAIHAGLECGIFSSKMKDLDMISFGPDIFDIHTPKERLSISSAKRVYVYLLRILEEFCKQDE